MQADLVASTLPVLLDVFLFCGVMALMNYHICSIRCHGYYLFHCAILCGFYSRAAFIKLSVIGRIFHNCKGFEKSQFNEELRCGDLVLKQTFQLLDQPPLCYKMVSTCMALPNHFLGFFQ